MLTRVRTGDRDEAVRKTGTSRIPNLWNQLLWSDPWAWNGTAELVWVSGCLDVSTIETGGGGGRKLPETKEL